MKKRIAMRRPSPAMAVALTALFVALGGTGYAAVSLPLPKNSVGTKQLRKGAVTTKKIKNGAVTAAKINTTGLTVPNALQANNANTAGSATNAAHAASAGALDNLTRLNWRVPTNTSAQTIYTSPGGKLTVTAACSSTNVITLTLTTSVDHAVLDSYGTSSDVQRADFVNATPVTFTNTAEERTIVYTEPGGQIVTLIYAVNNPGGISGVNCLLDGTAFAH